MSLRDRYLALLRCYPAAYRAERGDEIIDTYLDLARPGQRWPRPVDVADLVRGGLRQHLRARHALGLADAVPLAGTLALTAAAALAAVGMLGSVTLTVPEGMFWRGFGPFLTFEPAVWIAWLLAAVAAVAGFGRPFVVVALLVTVAVVPVAALASATRPSLLLLVPQVALGLVALGVPRRRRLLPVLAALTAAGSVVVTGVAAYDLYGLILVPPAVGQLLAFAALAAGIACTVRRDPRAWWTTLLLLGPVLLLQVPLTGGDQQPWPSWPTAVVASVVAVLVAGAAVPGVLWLRGRLHTARDAARCPTCGSTVRPLDTGDA